MAARFDVPLQFEVTQILLYYSGHGHTQCGRKVLQRHRTQLVGTLQKARQGVGQIPGIAGTVELDGQIFFIGHLPEVLKIGANDRHTIGARQVRHAAAAGGRRIGHYQRRGGLKKILNLIFLHVPGEAYAGMRSVLFLHRLDVAGCLRMIAAGDDKPEVRKTIGNAAKCLNEKLQLLVGAPFSEGENPVLWITSP